MRADDTLDGGAANTLAASGVAAASGADTLAAAGSTLDTLAAAGSALDTLAAGDAGGPGPRSQGGEAAELEPGAVVARHVVIARLGAGGMGVVYAAYDPQLDRKIALKLVRADVNGGTGSDPHTRLLREAQALARLNHPNVVAIHDVGVIADRVWLAMEHVDGDTLTAWLARRPHGWREVLEVLLAAGRGLVVAHAAGLVHRDLKPDNIMIDREGRVRVMDFGLARAAGHAPKRAAPAIAVDARVLHVSVTQAGSLMGTPAYMAPEQWRGEEADARVDQFAFCVTLWEAVHGEAPFAGDSPINLAVSVCAGKLRTPPPRAPAWLRRVLARGLQVDPAARFSSMAALLAALERGQAAGRARRVLLGVGVAALVAAGFAGWQRHDRSRRIDACEAAGAQIAGVWNPEAADALGRALLASGVAHAATARDRTLPVIDAWTREWSTMRAQVCREAEVDGTRSADLHARASACLDEQREVLVGLLAALGEGDRTAPQLAVPAATALPPLGSCSDRAALERRDVLADPELHTQVAALRRGLMQVRGLTSAGRYVEALRRAEALLAAAEPIAYAPLTVELQEAVGTLAARTGGFARAESMLARAYADAGAIGADETAERAALQLITAGGSAQGRPREGLLWARSADMLVRRLGHTDELPGAQYLGQLAVVQQDLGVIAEARDLYARALAIRERALGPNHPLVAVTLVNLATAHDLLGETDTAVPLFERALAVQTLALGDDHPLVAKTLNNLAAVHQARREFARALELEQRALVLLQQTFGDDHPDVAAALYNIAQTLAFHRPVEAHAVYERAIASWTRALGADHPDLAYALIGFGNYLVACDRAADAIAPIERAITLRSGADIPAFLLAEARFALADALRWAPAGRGNDPTRARDLAGQVAEVYRHLGPSHAAALAAVEAWLRDYPPERAR